MSSKRDYEDDSDGHISEPTTKRVKKQSGKSRQQQQSSGLDPTWGQKYVFSNQEAATTIPAGEESEFEDDADAMAYLMSVRYVWSTLCASRHSTRAMGLLLFFSH